MKVSFFQGLAIAAVLSVMVIDPATALAKGKPSNATNKRVELFAAMKSGEIEVQYIPASAKRANVLIKNKTKQPLSIQLPEAFAGVPILAQGFGGGGMMGGGGMGGGGMGGGGMGGGGGQGQGGGFGGGMGGGGMGGGGGFFDVQPEKVRKIRVTTVCLEHGKKDPNPRMKYTIVPIESFTKNKEVIELCKMLGSGRLSQSSAQVAAWHFTDKMSWQQLANKVGKVHLNGSKEPFFTRQELQIGFRIATVAKQRAEYFANLQKTVEKSDSLSER